LVCNCSIVLVRGVEGDRELWEAYRIERESFREPYAFWYFRLLYMMSGGLFLGGFNSDGFLVGYVVALQRIGGVCHVVSIAVRPECRGKGNGHVLLASIEEACRLEGARGVMLEVDAYNWPAQRLYLAHGYRYAVFLPDYYGPGRPAILMVKVLEG